MAMDWDPDTKILVMDRHNLGHCGFDDELLEAELFLNGIDDPEAKNPDGMIINFMKDISGGPGP